MSGQSATKGSFVFEVGKTYYHNISGVVVGCVASPEDIKLFQKNGNFPWLILFGDKSRCRSVWSSVVGPDDSSKVIEVLTYGDAFLVLSAKLEGPMPKNFQIITERGIVCTTVVTGAIGTRWFAMEPPT